MVIKLATGFQCRNMDRGGDCAGRYTIGEHDEWYWNILTVALAPSVTAIIAAKSMGV